MSPPKSVGPVIERVYTLSYLIHRPSHHPNKDALQAPGSLAVKESVKSPSKEETFSNAADLVLVNCDPISELSRNRFSPLHHVAGFQLALHRL